MHAACFGFPLILSESKSSPRGETSAPSIYDSHWTYSSMPRSASKTSPPPTQEEPRREGEGYMPGMTEKKKKKGFLSLFQKKRTSGKFNLVGVQHLQLAY